MEVEVEEYWADLLERFKTTVDEDEHSQKTLDGLIDDVLREVVATLRMTVPDVVYAINLANTLRNTIRITQTSRGVK